MGDSGWDYIVVGAGSAGAAVAGRLTEDDTRRVVLIEAGGEDEGDAYRVPSLWGLQFTTAADWDYYSEPEPQLMRRRLWYPRGKVLGGTSSMNAMLYVRGAPADFDEWARSGCEGWTWADVLPYFERLEDQEGSGSLGRSGQMKIANRISTNHLMEAWVEAAQAAGYRYNADFNGTDPEGVGFYQLTQSNGRRWSTADAYIRPALGRPNFELLMYSHVTRVLFEGSRAIGVEVSRFGKRRELRCESEVILSAGAYNSPQLLMLSGIGPADHLTATGIETREDLPVGDGLQDHPGVGLVVGVTGDSLFGLGSERDWESYRGDGGGRLASNIVEAGGFFRTHPELRAPDVQMVVLPTLQADDGLGVATEPAYTCVAEVAKPASVGTVRLRSNVPTAKPRIMHNHFASERDLRTQIAGTRIAMEISEQAPLASYQTKRLRFPTSSRDDDLRQYIREYGMGFFHPTSTCAMTRVVDSELKVLGFEGLRVVDASVMPTIVRANPNATTIMIGEKAADLIRGQ